MLRLSFSVILFLTGLIAACREIPRDNLLDPKNPDSKREQITTVEAFVNTNPEISVDYNLQLLEALNLLETKYMDRIIILEYHRNLPQYDDPDHSIENETLYSKYVVAVQAGSKGVPDVFFNGTASRVQGAYDAWGSTRIRLEQALEPLLIKNSAYAIEAAVNSGADGYRVTATVARLGNNDGSDILVKAVYISQRDDVYHRRVVRQIAKSNVISTIEAGDLKEVSFPPYQVSDQNPAAAVLMVTSSDELNVFQSIKVDLQ